MPIHNMIGGGSGAGLNLKVVGGTTQPTGSENTIWVNTSTAINGYVFSATEPENPVEGLVWIQTGTSSAAAINVDKKNAVMLYPTGCKQYVSGSLVDKTAKVYLNSEWVGLLVHSIVANGVLVDTLLTFGKKWDSSQSVGSNNMTVTQQSGYVSVKGSTTGFGAAYIQSDLTDAKEIAVDGTYHTGTHHKLAVWSSIGSYMTSNIVASVDLTEAGASLDVSSLSGSHYIGVTSEYNHEHRIVNFYTR